MTEIFIKTVEVNVGNLVALTAIALDDSLKDFDRALLLTKCKTEFVLVWPDVNDPCLLVLGYGDTSVG